MAGRVMGLPLLLALLVAGAALSAAPSSASCSAPPKCDTVECATARHAKGLPYRIPVADDPASLVVTEDRLDNEAVVTFVHVFKAGGSTVKNIITLASLLAGAYTSVGPSDIGWPSFVVEPEETRSLPRFISGAHGLGHCELTARPCLYFTVLRDPFDRMVSEYDYFCIKGREQRKEWNADWKKSGACGASLLDWAERTYARPTPRIGDWNWAEDGSNSTLPSHPNFLLERFSGNPDPVCGLADAKHNLAHPCMKYLMLPRPGNGDASLEEQLNRLASTLGPWINHTITHALQFQGHMTWKNVNTGKTTRTRDQSKDLEVAEKLREIIAADIELYEWAKANYEKQWETPYSFCHARPAYTGAGSSKEPLEYWHEWFGFLWSGTPFHVNQPWIDSLKQASPFIGGWFVLCVLAWKWKSDQAKKAAVTRVEVAAIEAAKTVGSDAQVKELQALMESLGQVGAGVAKGAEGAQRRAPPQPQRGGKTKQPPLPPRKKAE